MNPFTKHPNEVGETYLKHLAVALKMGVMLLMSSAAQIVHAIFPFIMPPYGTDVCSMVEYLESKKPDLRAQCNEEEK
jgi:hypothetical protein